MGPDVSAQSASNDDGSWQEPTTGTNFQNGSRMMEIVALLLLTITMVGIGWAANDRGEVRSAGSEEAARRMDA